MRVFRQRVCHAVPSPPYGHDRPPFYRFGPSPLCVPSLSTRLGLVVVVAVSQLNSPSPSLCNGGANAAGLACARLLAFSLPPLPLLQALALQRQHFSCPSFPVLALSPFPPPTPTPPQAASAAAAAPRLTAACTAWSSFRGACAACSRARTLLSTRSATRRRRCCPRRSCLSCPSARRPCRRRCPAWTTTRRRGRRSAAREAGPTSTACSSSPSFAWARWPTPCSLKVSCGRWRWDTAAAAFSRAHLASFPLPSPLALARLSAGRTREIRLAFVCGVRDALSDLLAWAEANSISASRMGASGCDGEREAQARRAVVSRRCSPPLFPAVVPRRFPRFGVWV